MALSVNNTICCCNHLLNIPSPNPNPTSSSSCSFAFPSGRRLPLPVLKNNIKAVDNHQISCTTQSQRKEEEAEEISCSWRRKRNQCVLGMMACMIINSTNLSLPSAAAAAADSSSFTTTTTHQQAATTAAAAGKKWSDKQRVCQPWRLNSLETIVPENLPRPSAHRRSESINNSTTTTSSSSILSSPPPPLVNSNIVLVNNCFTM